MEFGPIFRTLFRNKTRFFLVGAEVALTLAIAVNCINMMVDTRRTMNRPTGLDEANLVAVRSHPFSPDFREEEYLDNVRRSDLELLRSLPGVRAAEAVSAIPLSGSGSSTAFKPLDSEMDSLATAWIVAGPRVLDVLGVRLVAGRDLTEADVTESDSKNVIVTQAYADRLFPDGDALGGQIQGRTADSPHTIVGVIERMHGPWPMWHSVEHVTLSPGKPGDFNWGVIYLVRTAHREDGALLRNIEERLLGSNDGRNLTVRPLVEIKADTYSASHAVVRLLGVVIFLLIAVTALGIIGITSFSVTERTRQIGTRRALGARRLDILRLFLLENGIITSAGLAVGVGFAFGLNYLLVSYVGGVKLDTWLLGGGVLLLWLIGQASAFIPALRGTRISPALAARSL